LRQQILALFTYRSNNVLLKEYSKFRNKIILNYILTKTALKMDLIRFFFEVEYSKIS